MHTAYRVYELVNAIYLTFIDPGWSQVSRETWPKQNPTATGRLLVRSLGSAWLSVEVSLGETPPNPNCS